MTRKLRKLDLKRVKQGDEIWTYQRDPQKRIDRELDSVFRALIGWANEDPRDEKSLTTKWLGQVRPRHEPALGVFNKHIVHAHELAREWLNELAANGQLKRRSESLVTECMREVRQHRLFTLENGRPVVWSAFDVPTATGFVAYCLTSMVGWGLEDNVGRCRLSECRKFFWAPTKRGPRPTYCCERHRLRGSKREQRGQKP